VQHVFISYKHEDLDFAENVINRIEKAGFSTWTDDKLHAGDDWRAMIDIAIKNAFALIAIMTPEAKASEYVTYEWAFAWGVGVKVIPLMLRPTRLHPRLEALQYLDFTSPKARPWERLVEEVKSAVHAPLTHTVHIPLNSPPYLRQAVMALDSPVEGDRTEAIKTLKQIRRPEIQGVLLEALQHPIADVRWESARTLGELGVTTAVPALMELMHDPQTAVRQASAGALGKLGDTTAIPVLTERLHDPDTKESECKEVAIAMGKLGDVAAIPKLIEILCNTYGYYRYMVHSQQWEEIGSLIGSLGDVTLISVLRKAEEESPGFLSLGDEYHRRRQALGLAIRMMQQRIDEGEHKKKYGLS
jgi:hypothetical protein